jgi:tetratricopeptide (TPR) repeat protein
MFNSRLLMFTVSSFWVALILVVLVFRGGGAVPLESRPAPSALPSAADLAKQAAALADLGDYEGAWGLYHEALVAAPEDVSLWYALGVTLSRLNQRQETEEAFGYVVTRGNPDSEEVRVARDWLVSAGVLARPAAFTTAVVAAADVADAKAAMKGKVTWGSERNPMKVRILVHGLSGAAEGRRFNTRATLGQAYRFEHLPAGSYRLIGRAENGALLWDQRIDVEDGKEIALDLTRENSSNPTVALSR